MSPKKKRQDNAVKDLPPKRKSKNLNSAESSKVKGGSTLATFDGQLANVDLQNRPYKESLLPEADLSGKVIGRETF